MTTKPSLREIWAAVEERGRAIAGYEAVPMGEWDAKAVHDLVNTQNDLSQNAYDYLKALLSVVEAAVALVNGVSYEGDLPQVDGLDLMKLEELLKALK